MPGGTTTLNPYSSFSSRCGSCVLAAAISRAALSKPDSAHRPFREAMLFAPAYRRAAEPILELRIQAGHDAGRVAWAVAFDVWGAPCSVSERGAVAVVACS